MNLSIRSKLILSFLVILILATALVGITFTLNDQFIRSQQIAILDTKTHSATNSLMDYLLSIKQDQQKIVDAYVSGDGNNIEAATKKARDVLEESPSTSSVVILNKMGRQLAKITNDGTTPANQLSIELPTDNFKRALNTDVTISKVFFESGSISPQVIIYTPAIYSTGEVGAVVKSQIELSLLPELLSSLELGEQGMAYVIDNEGLIVSHPHAGRINGQQILQRPVINKLISSGYASLSPDDHYYRNEEDVEVIASSNVISELGWILVVEQPTSVVFNQLNTTRTLLIGSLFAAFVLMFIIAIVISSGLARPIRFLTERAKRLEKGDFTAQDQVHSGDELERLSNSFNSMATQLNERQQSLKQANKSLTVERDRQETLLQSLNDGVIAVDSKHTIILFNKAAEKITGLKAESVIGRNINAAIQLYYHEKLIPLEQYSVQATRNKKKIKTDGLTISTDRGQLYLSLSVDPIKLDQDGQNGWIITFSDMTKEKEFETMKLDFVSMAAHELRTPLTAMRGYLSLLNDEAGEKLTKDELRYLERSFISANQLNSLVENLLNLSRVERGALKLTINPIAVDTIIDGVLDNLSGIAKQKNIALTFNGAQKQIVVMADQFRITEVVTNLVGNAINYTAAGGKVDIKVTTDKEKATISIIDNGQGIPASAISHLFTKFYRVQSSLAMGSKGTGLGLYISKAIIDAHRGKIWVESVEGKGSTFSFTLYLAPKNTKMPVLGKAT